MNVMLAVTNITAGNGGVTTHILDLCKQLNQRNVKVCLVSDKNDCDTNYLDAITELEKSELFKFISVNLSGVQRDARRLFETVKQFSKIVNDERIDIMHMHSQSLCVVGAFVKLKTGIPYIWTNHIDEMANPKLFKKILKILHFPIISVSLDLKNMLINEYGVKENRITVVNNGINLDKFSPLTEEEINNLKKEYECENKYVIGLLARMSYGKGHMYLLEAVNKMQNENNIKDIKVLIAGKLHKREYLDKLLTYSAEHNIDVKYLGFRKPRDVFGICDISTLPSIYEGFGLTVIESLAMSCPVIRSDTPGWADTKDIALIFKKGDVDGLAKHLIYAYNNRAAMQEMGKKGQKAVFDKFTIEKQVELTMEVYNKIKIKRK